MWASVLGFFLLLFCYFRSKCLKHCCAPHGVLSKQQTCQTCPLLCRVVRLMLLYMPVSLLQQMFIYTEISIPEEILQ